MKDAVKKNLVLTLVLWLVLFVAGMTAMLQVALHKTIVIAEAEQAGIAGGDGQTAEKQGSELALRGTAGEKNCIHIPLESSIKAEDVSLENRYVEHELWIYLKGATEAFYGLNAVYGDISLLDGGTCEQQKEGVLLKIHAKKIFEFRSTMEGGVMSVEFYEPASMYEKIVVIDPVGGGSDSGLQWGELSEKDIVLQLAQLLQKRMWQSDVKVYFTRLEDVDVSAEKRAALVEETGADLFLRIGVSVDEEDPGSYGISSLYNEEYYIPEFGNVQFADAVTRQVTISTVNRAVGLFPAEENSILADIKIPAAHLNVGYLSNEKESALLSQEAYLEKIAAGIERAILEAGVDGKWGTNE